MTRIQGVTKSQASPMVKVAYRFGPKMMKKLTGREPQNGNGLEPMEIWAYQPKMMMGMGRFNQAVRKGHSVDEADGLAPGRIGAAGGCVHNDCPRGRDGRRDGERGSRRYVAGGIEDIERSGDRPGLDE